jgi:hypothetical protein
VTSSGPADSSGLNKIPVCQGIGIDKFYCIYIYIYMVIFVDNIFQHKIVFFSVNEKSSMSKLYMYF